MESTENGADPHIDRLAKQYLGVDSYPYWPQSEKRGILRIEPRGVVDAGP